MNRTFHDTETRWYERLVEVGSAVCVPFNDASRTSGAAAPCAVRRRRCLNHRPSYAAS
jgi:hypothetical protein